MPRMAPTMTACAVNSGITALSGTWGLKGGLSVMPALSGWPSAVKTMEVGATDPDVVGDIPEGSAIGTAPAIRILQCSFVAPRLRELPNQGPTRSAALRVAAKHQPRELRNPTLDSRFRG